VRAAAQLHRDSVDVHDAHDIAVLLTEQRHRALRPRLWIRHLSGRDRRSLENLLVHDGFDLLQLLRGDRAVMGEIEAQAIRRDE
jgi:hypothetical protein